jgi:hypothetical protein
MVQTAYLGPGPFQVVFDCHLGVSLMMMMVWYFGAPGCDLQALLVVSMFSARYLMVAAILLQKAALLRCFAAAIVAERRTWPAMVFHDSRLDFDTLDPELLAQPSSMTCWKPARFQKPCDSSLLSGSSTCLTALTTLTFQPVLLLMDALRSITINPFIGLLEKQLPASRTAPGRTCLDVTCVCLYMYWVLSLWPLAGLLVVQRNDYFKKSSRQLAEVCCNVLSATCKAKEAVLECGPSVADVVAQRDDDFNPKLCRMVEFAIMLSRPSCCGWRWTPRFAVIDRRGFLDFAEYDDLLTPKRRRGYLLDEYFKNHPSLCAGFTSGSALLLAIQCYLGQSPSRVFYKKKLLLWMKLTATWCPALDGDLLRTALKPGKTPATCFVGHEGGECSLGVVFCGVLDGLLVGSSGL